MALERQSLPIILGVKGLDTKSDPHAVQPPALTELENFVFESPGSLRKRLGTAALGSSAPASLQTVLTTFGAELLTLANGTLSSYTPGGGNWTSRGSVSPASVVSRVVAQGVSSYEMADGATSGGIQVRAWRDTNDNFIYAQIVDAVTGTIYSTTKLSSGAVSTHGVQVIAQGLYIAVLYPTGTSISGRRMLVSAPGSGWAAEVALAGLGTVGSFACVPGSGAFFHLAVRDTAAGSVKLAAIDPSGPSVLGSPAITTIGGVYAAGVGALSLCESSGRLLVLCEQGATNLTAYVVNASTYAAIGNTSMGTEGGTVRQAACCPDGSGNWFAWYTVWNSSASTTDFAASWVRGVQIKNDSTITAGPTTLLYGHTLASSAIAPSSAKGYVWARQYTSQQSAYLLIDVSGNVLGRALPLRAVERAALRTTGRAGTLPQIQALGSSKYLTLLPSLEAGAAGTVSLVTGVATVTLDFSFRARPAAIRQGLFLPGGLPQVYDGNTLTECGFLAFPEVDLQMQVQQGAQTAWAAATVYAVGNVQRPTQPNGYAYRVTAVSGAATSAGVEPTWPTTPGATVIDNPGPNQITWTCDRYSLAPWLATTTYKVGALVQPAAVLNGFWYMATVQGATAGAEPTWPTTIGSTVNDGAATWRCMGQLGTPGLADGTRAYYVVYEWLDAKGQLHRSLPSGGSGVTVSLATGQGAALLRLSPLRATAKTGVRVVVYRTNLGSSIPVVVGSVPNDATQQYMWFLDSVTDAPIYWTTATAKTIGQRVQPTASIGVQARCTTAGTTGATEPTWPRVVGQTVTDGTAVWTMEATAATTAALYTTPGALTLSTGVQLTGEIPHFPPPACQFAVARAGRLVLAGLETDGNLITMSKAGATMFPGFNSLSQSGLAYACDQAGGDITAIAALDEKIIAFKPQRIAYFVGDPPDDNALSSGTLAPSDPLAADTGAVSQHGLLLTDDGFYFAASRGLYLLRRDLGVEYVGAPVEAIVGKGTSITGGAVMSTKTQLRWTTSGGIVVYDTLVDAWGKHTGVVAVDIAIYNDLAVYATSGGVVTEVAGSWADSGTPVLVKLTTGWIAPQGPLAWMRAERMHLVGALQSQSTWKMSEWHDGQTNATATQTWAATTSDTGDGNVGSDAQFRVDFGRQLCRSVKVRLEEIDSLGAGIYLHALALIWRPKDVEQKNAAAQQKG